MWASGVGSAAMTLLLFMSRFTQENFLPLLVLCAAGLLGYEFELAVEWATAVVPVLAFRFIPEFSVVLALVLVLDVEAEFMFGLGFGFAAEPKPELAFMFAGLLPSTDGTLWIFVLTVVPCSIMRICLLVSGEVWKSLGYSDAANRSSSPAT